MVFSTTTATLGALIRRRGCRGCGAHGCFHRTRTRPSLVAERLFLLHIVSINERLAESGEGGAGFGFGGGSVRARLEDREGFREHGDAEASVLC